MKEKNELNVQILEHLTEEDKSILDLAKMKRELALANAKAALAQNESAGLSYDNVILKLAIKYQLSDGDTITDTGEIKRIPVKKAPSERPTGTVQVSEQDTLKNGLKKVENELRSELYERFQKEHTEKVE